MTRIFCDSSTRRACIVVEGASRPRIIVYPEPVTNNVGEYKAVLEALALAEKLGREDVEILTDSQLVVNQVNGSWKCRMPHLLPFRDKVRDLLLVANFFAAWHWRLSWIPREENLAGKVLG